MSNSVGDSPFIKLFTFPRDCKEKKILTGLAKILACCTLIIPLIAVIALIITAAVHKLRSQPEPDADPASSLTYVQKLAHYNFSESTKGYNLFQTEFDACDLNQSKDCYRLRAAVEETCKKINTDFGESLEKKHDSRRVGYARMTRYVSKHYADKAGKGSSNLPTTAVVNAFNIILVYQFQIQDFKGAQKTFQEIEKKMTPQYLSNDRQVELIISLLEKVKEACKTFNKEEIEKNKKWQSCAQLLEKILMKALETCPLVNAEGEEAVRLQTAIDKHKQIQQELRQAIEG